MIVNEVALFLYNQANAPVIQSTGLEIPPICAGKSLICD